MHQTINSTTETASPTGQGFYICSDSESAGFYSGFTSHPAAMRHCSPQLKGPLWGTLEPDWSTLCRDRVGGWREVWVWVWLENWCKTTNTSGQNVFSQEGGCFCYRTPSLSRTTASWRRTESVEVDWVSGMDATRMPSYGAGRRADDSVEGGIHHIWLMYPVKGKFGIPC